MVFGEKRGYHEVSINNLKHKYVVIYLRERSKGNNGEEFYIVAVSETINSGLQKDPWIEWGLCLKKGRGKNVAIISVENEVDG